MRNLKRKQLEVKESTVMEALNEAEREHWLDSPVSDPWTRAAAFSLDAILLFLGVTGINSICSAMGLYLSHFPVASAPAWMMPLLHDPLWTAGALAIGLKITFAYFYVIWSMTFAGGSPAKLLFGLRIIDDHSGYFPSLGKVLLRLSIQLGLSPLMGLAFFSKRRTAPHDQWTGTSVRKVEEDP